MARCVMVTVMVFARCLCAGSSFRGARSRRRRRLGVAGGGRAQRRGPGPHREEGGQDQAQQAGLRRVRVACHCSCARPGCGLSRYGCQGCREIHGGRRETSLREATFAIFSVFKNKEYRIESFSVPK